MGTADCNGACVHAGLGLQEGGFQRLVVTGLVCLSRSARNFISSDCSLDTDDNVEADMGKDMCIILLVNCAKASWVMPSDLVNIKQTLDANRCETNQCMTKTLRDVVRSS